MYKNAKICYSVPSVVHPPVSAEEFSKRTMIFRISLILLIFSFLFFAFNDCLSDPTLGDDQFVDDFSVVELPENGMVFDKVDKVEGRKSNDQSAERKTRRIKRSAMSLPPNTSNRFLLDWIIPISPLNNTFSSLLIDLSYRFVLPTYTQLNNLYGTLGRLDEDSENAIDYDFFEEQRANKERRSIYQHAESLFETMGYDGQNCLLRAICELAEAPLAHHGLVGKLIDLIFSPNALEVPKFMEPYLSGNRIRRDTTNIPELEVLQMPVQDEYTEAYRAGKEGKCWTRYYTCPISIFKLLTF